MVREQSYFVITQNDFNIRSADRVQNQNRDASVRPGALVLENVRHSQDAHSISC